VSPEGLAAVRRELVPEVHALEQPTGDTWRAPIEAGGAVVEDSAELIVPPAGRGGGAAGFTRAPPREGVVPLVGGGLPGEVVSETWGRAPGAALTLALIRAPPPLLDVLVPAAALTDGPAGPADTFAPTAAVAALPEDPVPDDPAETVPAALAAVAGAEAPADGVTAAAVRAPTETFPTWTCALAPTATPPFGVPSEVVTEAVVATP
jgi:hypothetical protein